MIFYSDNIINNIIDNGELHTIAEEVDQFKKDIEMIFTYFTYPIISLDYIQNLLKFESNKIAFYCMEDKFVIRSCPSCMIYSKQNKKNSDTILYYIMVISTNKEFRGQGYATKLLSGFVERVKEETKLSTKKVKIVLSSVDEVVSYYQKYGFEAVDYSFDNYPYFRYFEKYDEEKIYTIMELDIN
jgi:ribosomal protein S18 acetylase RimI-like enzyme